MPEGGNPQEADRPVLGPGQERLELPSVLPVLPVRDLVVFPGVTVPLAIGRPRSLAALEMAGPGGFLIVDDYGIPQDTCRRAIDDFRKLHDIREPIVDIDGFGAYWRRSADGDAGA